MKTYTILYVGPLVHGGTCKQRMEALIELGHRVIAVDTLPCRAERISSLFVYRVWRKLFGPIDLSAANVRIVQAAKNLKPDIVWVDKGLTIKFQTLKKIRSFSEKSFLVSYSPDDMMNPNNQSRHYLACIGEYDLHVTTKSYNVAELKELGAKEVIMVDNAFSPSVHYPVQPTSQQKTFYGGPVGFIGFSESHRKQSMTYLAEKGVKVRIWGPWNKNDNYHPNLVVEGKPLWVDEYRTAICSFDINLHFLRKANRDLQTTRSIEIPACGAFMLAERTEEHLRLFEEGKEAEFFGSDEELAEKVIFYQNKPELRRKIGAAGRERCLRSGYSNHDRLKFVLAKIEDLRKKI